MKIAHLSNIANIGYMNVKALRGAGIDARLYFNPEAPYGISHPAWEDKGLKENMPGWIKQWQVKKNLINPFYHVRSIMELRSFDLLHAYTLSSIYALFTGVQYVAQTTGADILEMAGASSLIGHLYRLSLKAARTVFFSNINHLTEVRRLRIERSRFIPFSIDTEKYRPSHADSGNGPFALLHSSRLDWKSKGNDRFFRALPAFIAKNPDTVVRVFCSGPDVEKTKNLVGELGIEGNVQFLPQVTKEELIGYYHLSDLIVDQFIVGGFGINALEAMACGKAVLTFCDEPSCLECYGQTAPVLNARSVEEISGSLFKTIDRQFLKKLGSEARVWVESHHSFPVTRKILVDTYTAILHRESRGVKICG